MPGLAIAHVLAWLAMVAAQGQQQCKVVNYPYQQAACCGRWCWNTTDVFPNENIDPYFNVIISPRREATYMGAPIGDQSTNNSLCDGGCMSHIEQAGPLTITPGDPPLLACAPNCSVEIRTKRELNGKAESCDWLTTDGHMHCREIPYDGHCPSGTSCTEEYRVTKHLYINGQLVGPITETEEK